MPAKTPSKGKKATAPKAPKKAAAAGKAAKKPAIVDEEAHIADEPEHDDDDDDDDDFEADGDDEAPRAAAKPAAAAAVPAKKPAAAPASRGKPLVGEDAPAVVPARRLTPEAKARVNEMVKKGMSLGDALKAAAAWETFVAPVKDEPAKLVQGRMGGSQSGGAAATGDAPRSNFGGETEPEDLPEADEEPAVADED
jgi:hypothetical protein